MRQACSLTVFALPSRIESKFRSIRANWKVDSEPALLCVHPVVIFQPTPHFAGLSPNHRIVSRGVVHWAVEESSSDHALFQGIWVILQTVLDHETEKLLSAGASPEGFAFQNVLESFDNQRRVGKPLFLFPKWRQLESVCLTMDRRVIRLVGPWILNALLAHCVSRLLLSCTQPY